MTSDRRKPRALILKHGRNYALDLRREAEALSAAGFECEVLYLGEGSAPPVQIVGGVTLVRLPGRKSRGGALSYILEYGGFTAVAAGVLTFRHLRDRYDVIQVNTMPDFLVFAAVVPKLMGCPIVLCMKEPTPELAATLGRSRGVVRVLERVEQLALRFADHAITVTDELKRRYVEHGIEATKVTVVLNGPDPRHILGESLPPPHSSRASGSLIVLCHGTIEERYGHEMILQAAALAGPRIARLEIVVTGSGSGVAKMLENRTRLGLDHLVRYEGWVTKERLEELLRQADLGIVAQRPSPYSHLVHTNKMFDYWIAGLPVLASRLDATAALFGDHEIAYYDGDDPAELAEQMVSLAHDPARRRELARKGREAWMRVGWHVQRDRYLDVFRRLLGDRFPVAGDQ